MDALVEYYDGKTRAIIENMGQGRVFISYRAHGRAAVSRVIRQKYRTQLVASQERMLRYASETWQLQMHGLAMFSTSVAALAAAQYGWRRNMARGLQE